ncbi:MAG TPA: ABC transporter permease [Polyangiaceae bacterium]|jgi:putative ABC transport system permease protein|nr:ABC transporter permease [Polyangiaceae bacterium]
MLTWARESFGWLSFSALDELISTLRRNKLRTLLTGLSVTWGTFMLVLLLGAGKGLENGIVWEFRDDAVNSIWAWAGLTSVPYAGRGPNREVRFKNDDYAALRREIPGIEHLSGRFWMWGEFSVRRGERHSAFDVIGVHPDQRYIEKTLMIAGRYVNARDLDERRKVAVIGSLVRTALFGNEEPIGKYIEIRGLAYRVVGVFVDEGGEAELRRIYVPITTTQLVYNDPGHIHTFGMTTGAASTEQSRAVEEQAHRLLAKRHQVSLDDARALRTQNNLVRFEKLSAVFRWVNGFVWFVSFGTLLSGMVSVSNIMLISVAERTREIGIRKALGATPFRLVGMVLSEALLITSIAGYAGVVAGVALVELGRNELGDVPFVRQPSVSIATALTATALIVLAGALAGFFPALRAARVSPVAAMREE